MPRRAAIVGRDETPSASRVMAGRTGVDARHETGHDGCGIYGRMPDPSGSGTVPGAEPLP